MTLETKLKLAPWMETQCSRQAPTESKQSVAKAKYTINQHGLVQQIITKCVVCGKHSASFRVYKVSMINPSLKKHRYPVGEKYKN